MQCSERARHLPVAANTNSAARWISQQLFLSSTVLVFVKSAYLEQLETVHILISQ
jgi:hypothetical protein